MKDPIRVRFGDGTSITLPRGHTHVTYEYGRVTASYDDRPTIVYDAVAIECRWELPTSLAV
ncbi:hypothetical protein [Tsukamurella soli]|uniref:Uncharacterized protein n=1 Tax=Tsukamurella soli TaxID=644556 RepID=A0ABP8J6S0_9ACTN